MKVKTQIWANQPNLCFSGLETSRGQKYIWKAYFTGEKIPEETEKTPFVQFSAFNVFILVITSNPGNNTLFNLR